MTTPTNNPFQNLKAGAETVAADVSKAVPVVEADAAKVKATLVAVDNKATTWLLAHAHAFVTGVLVAAVLYIFHKIL